MSDVKLREALASFVDAMDIFIVNTEKGLKRLDEAEVLAREALAQPAEALELTDEEIVNVAINTQSAEPGRDGYILPFTFARAIIAAYEYKRSQS